MSSVKHGKPHNVGLLIHYIIQSQQWEILDRKKVSKEKEKIPVSDNVWQCVKILHWAECDTENEMVTLNFWWRKKKKDIYSRNSNLEEIEVDGNDSCSFKQKYMHKTSEAGEHIKYRR